MLVLLSPGPGAVERGGDSERDPDACFSHRNLHHPVAFAKSEPRRRPPDPRRSQNTSVWPKVFTPQCRTHKIAAPVQVQAPLTPRGAAPEDAPRAQFVRIRSDGDDAGAKQVRERFPLLVVEHRVDALKRLRLRVSEPRRARDARGAGLGNLRGVECRRREKIRHGGRHPPMVDRGLRAFGLEVVEDCRELGRLRVVEAELESEKAERSPDAERAAESARLVAVRTKACLLYT